MRQQLSTDVLLYFDNFSNILKMKGKSQHIKMQFDFVVWFKLRSSHVL